MLKRSPWPVILQVIPNLSAGGAERTVIEVAEAVTLAGGKALVATEGGMLEAELVAVGGEVIRFPAATKNPARIIANAMRLEGLIAKRGITLVHARSRAPAWSAYLATRRPRKAFVTTYHGIYSQKGRAKAFYNGVMARGDAVICNSEYTASAVRERHPWAADRLEVIYRGVDLERFRRELVPENRVASLRSAWGVPGDAQIVLLPARVTPWKGHEVLIEAAHLILQNDAFRRLVFVCAGDNQGRVAFQRSLDELVTAKGLRGRVFFPGNCDDMPAAYAAAALTVIPSVQPEAFGRTAVEAQAMRCPVIVSRSGALPETVRADETAAAESVAAHGYLGGAPRPDGYGWIVEPGDAAGLARMIQSVLTASRETLAIVTEQANANVRKRFSKTALQLKTLGVYDRLLGTQLVAAFAKSGREDMPERI
jgi:glycosyltransferase involved in cell wall biosynthesis